MYQQKLSKKAKIIEKNQRQDKNIKKPAYSRYYQK